MYLPISMSYNMLIRSLLWFVKYRFIILLFCAIYCYLPDYLLLNFIRNCEKKKCLLFYLHFFFSEVNFYCSYVDYFVDGFVFSNPQIENNKNMFWDAARSCWECVLIENLLSNLLHLINVGNNVCIF